MGKHFKENCEIPSRAKQTLFESCINDKDDSEDMEETDKLKTVENEMMILLPNVIAELSNVDKVDGILIFKLMIKDFL